MSDFDEERMDIIGQNGNDGAFYGVDLSSGEDESISVVSIYDDVNHPKHYRLSPNMEAIEVIEIVLSHEEFKGYLKGNILKYRLRAGNKGDAQKDIAKANWYSNKLNEVSSEAR